MPGKACALDGLGLPGQARALDGLSYLARLALWMDLVPGQACALDGLNLLCEAHVLDGLGLPCKAHALDGLGCVARLALLIDLELRCVALAHDQLGQSRVPESNPLSDSILLYVFIPVETVAVILA